MSQPAVFFDRDGTLMEEVHYCSDPALVRLIPGTIKALERVKAAGYQAFIITNQAGIGRGLFTEEQYHAVHAELMRQIGAESGLVAATYYCADIPSLLSSRRKPEPGMVFEAERDFGIDLGKSWFVGDKGVDVGCGQRAGTRTILVQTGYGLQETVGVKPDFVAKDVVAAAEIIVQNGND